MNLAFKSQEDRKFPTAPEGLCTAVLCDVVERGLLPDFYNNNEPREKISLIFQTEALESEGGKEERFLIIKNVNRTDNDGGNLYKYLMAAMGGKVDQEAVNEDGTINTDKLVGRSVNLILVHNPEGTRAYAKDVSPVKAKDRDTTKIEDYIRPVFKNGDTGDSGDTSFSFND